MSTKLAERISLLRKNKGLTQEDFAAKIGATRQAVINWESGIKPQKKFVESILTTFPDLRREWLIDGAKPMFELKIPMVEEAASQYLTKQQTATEILKAYFSSMDAQVAALTKTQDNFRELVLRLE